jgi:DNA repair protein RadC
MAITDWPVGEQPREKLLTRGAASLSDAELLAIFLRTGMVVKARWIWRASCSPSSAA